MHETAWMHKAWVLDRGGGGRSLTPEETARWTSADGPLFVVLDRESERAREWLTGVARLPAVLVESLLAQEARPRCSIRPEGLMVMLRGVNLNPGADPDDMVTVRGWFDEHRAILLRGRRVYAIEDLREQIKEGVGPRRTGELLVRLSQLVADRIAECVGESTEQVDALEDRVPTERDGVLRTELAELRRQAMTLRRYCAPQRDALSRLMVEPLALLTDSDRLHLRETVEELTHAVEDLDLTRERAAIAQEHLMARTSERLARSTYRLSAAASIFLPLSLLVGLLGANVAGIPLAEHPRAFWFVVGMLALIGGGMTAIFRWRGWL